MFLQNPVTLLTPLIHVTWCSGLKQITTPIKQQSTSAACLDLRIGLTVVSLCQLELVLLLHHIGL